MLRDSVKFYRFAAKQNQKFIAPIIVRSYPHLTDKFSLQKMALQCNRLTEFFRGAWSADNFPSMCIDNEEDGKASFKL